MEWTHLATADRSRDSGGGCRTDAGLKAQTEVGGARQWLEVRLPPTPPPLRGPRVGEKGLDSPPLPFRLPPLVHSNFYFHPLSPSTG